MAVDIFDDDGQPLRQAKGELVCTAPFPAMPIYFWQDKDGKNTMMLTLVNIKMSGHMVIMAR